jgi:MYXO-CTERM domain-containing protein
LIPGAAAWIESTSGVDITPCHDIEGNWSPGPLCRGFNAQDPGYGGDTWANWCSNVATIGWADTCGKSLPELDNEPPTAVITNPTDGTVFDEAPGVFDLQVDAQDDLDYIKVEIEINGTIQPLADETPPYQFSGVNFPAGAWTLRAVATDAANNVVYSAPVGIGVGQEAPQTSGGEDGGLDAGEDGGLDAGEDGGLDAGEDGGLDAGEDGGTGGIGGSGGGGIGDGDDARGCSIAPMSNGPTTMALLLLGGLLLRRRRD